MNEHLDLDTLADVLAGEPSSHLDGCAQCRTEVEALRAAMGLVATSLAALPDPQPPPGLEQRLAAAIAKERRELSGGAAGAAAAVTPLAARRQSARWLPIGAGVAAAAALVLSGVLLLPRGGGAAHNSADSPSTPAPAPAGYRTSSTGTDYRKDGTLLDRELPALLSGAGHPEALSRAAPTGTTSPKTRAQTARIDPLADLRTTHGLASCLTSLDDASDASLPLALDYASFEGQPALVVVLPAAKPDKVDVFVVGAACSQADAKVLFFTRLAKPSSPTP